MRANKEVCKKVIAFMNKTTDEWLKGAGSVESANTSGAPLARYSFKKNLEELGLIGEDARYRINDIIIACPFHDDESPSFSFNDKKHTYHCFSCGCHGNIVNFLADYDRKIKGFEVSYYQKLNTLVREDPILRAELQIDSIYENEKITLEQGMKKFVFKAERKTFRPTSYLELASYMKRNHCTIQQIKLFVLLMQSGIEPVEIYRELYNIENSDAVEGFDLSQIMEE